ncbi:MAG: VOC family protein [Myxococcota bacterium]
MLESISAVTLFVADMARSVRFYDALGFEMRYGGADSEFTSYHVGPGYMNLALRSTHGTAPEIETAWGRAILYVRDVDAMHTRILEAGFTPEFTPRDAFWGERYFHVRDPDGHELSFAKLLDPAN